MKVKTGALPLGHIYVQKAKTNSIKSTFQEACKVEDEIRREFIESLKRLSKEDLKELNNYINIESELATKE